MRTSDYKFENLQRHTGKLTSNVSIAFIQSINQKYTITLYQDVSQLEQNRVHHFYIREIPHKQLKTSDLSLPRTLHINLFNPHCTSHPTHIKTTEHSGELPTSRTASSVKITQEAALTTSPLKKTILALRTLSFCSSLQQTDVEGMCALC